MRLDKYAIILDHSSGPLRAIVPQIEEMAFQAIIVPEPRAALDFARVYSKLALVAINGSCVAHPERMIDALRMLHVPLIWLGAGGDALATEDQELKQRQRLLAHAPSPKELASLAESLVREHYYPPKVQEKLSQAASVTMAAFGIQAALRPPFLRASCARLDELNAVLSFAGDGLAGHVLVSSTDAAVQGVARRVFGIREEDVQDQHRADVVGELCNTILGRIMAYFDERGVPVRFGVPLYIRGAHGGEVWNEAQAPSLCLEYETGAGSFFIELSFSELEQPDVLLHSRASHAPIEECIFL